MPSPSLRHRCCPCANSGCPCPSAAALPRVDRSRGRHLHKRHPAGGRAGRGHPTVGRPYGLIAANHACGLLPLRDPGSIQPPPLQGTLAAADCPYNRPGHGWPPLQGAWPWLAIIRIKTLALIPLLRNLSGSITCAIEIKT
ncbi:hypothetical protein BHE74_00054386 [Ensete ventricosum]|nr:hypothetical protein BHE74_00054386 [Ensete ventricosum]